MVDNPPGRWNGKNLVVHHPEYVIESDASSLKGWGAAYLETRIGGPWSRIERRYHINCLEIMAEHLAIKTLLKDKTNVTVLVMIDNRSNKEPMDVVPGERHLCSVPTQKE